MVWSSRTSEAANGAKKADALQQADPDHFTPLKPADFVKGRDY